MTRITSGTAAPALEPQDVPGALSFSQYTKLHPSCLYSCPRQWAYRYRLSLPEKRSGALVMGWAFDEAANSYFGARLAGTDRLTASAQAIERGFEYLTTAREADPELWSDQEAEEQQSVLMAAWAVFLEREGGAEVAAVQSKHVFTLRLDDRSEMPVVGYSDRLDSDGTLVDHKLSGSPRWDKDGNWHEDWLREKRDQLLTYWLARAAEEKHAGSPLVPPLSGRARLIVIYHHRGLVAPQVRVRELSLSLDGEALALLQRLGEAARTAQAGRYPARPGRACSFCSFVETCRRDEEQRGTPFFQLIEVPF